MRRLTALSLLLVVPVAMAAGYVPDKYAATAYKKAQTAGADVVKNPKEGDAAAITAGQAIFVAKCVTCHGTGGKGDGPAAVALDPHPADFTDGGRWAASSQGTKQWVVLNGVQGTGMVPPGLSPDDAWAVLAYIHKTFEPNVP